MGAARGVVCAACSASCLALHEHVHGTLSPLPPLIAPFCDVCGPAYDNKPLLQQLCTEALTSDPVYLAGERQPHIQATREVLTEHMPHFASAQFKWIHAADFYMCAAGLGMDVPEPLQPYSQTAIMHSLWRFSELFSCLVRRSLAAGGLLQTMADAMHTAMLTNLDDAQSTCPHFHIHSGHDVTLMPLVHCLTGRRMSEWPAYASAVTVELHRLQKKDGGTEFGVLARYNGEALWVDSRFADTLAHPHEDRKHEPVSHNPRMVTVDAFSSLAAHYDSIAEDALQEAGQVQGAGASHDDAV